MTVSAASMYPHRVEIRDLSVSNVACTYYDMNTLTSTHDMKPDVKDWCKANLERDFLVIGSVNPFVVRFQDENDAILFKLTWG